MLSSMPSHAVIVDVAIDQGGCTETSRPTTHEAPTYVIDDVLHYCVANMPGAVPVTSTRALTNATLPYLHRLTGLGLDGFRLKDPGFAMGVNVRDHKVVHPAVAATYEPPDEDDDESQAERAESRRQRARGAYDGPATATTGLVFRGPAPGLPIPAPSGSAMLVR